MGTYAKRLQKKLASQSAGLPDSVPQRRPGEPLPGGITDLETLIQTGHDPAHAAYVYIQQISSHFAEGVASMPGMKTWRSGNRSHRGHDCHR